VKRLAAEQDSSGAHIVTHVDQKQRQISATP
jgi:hypothetical protein